MNAWVENNNTAYGNNIGCRKRQQGKMDLWEVLNEYADVRDAFDDMAGLIENVLDDLRISALDIADELDEIQDRLDACDRVFRRFQIREEPDLPFMQPYMAQEGSGNENSI